MRCHYHEGREAVSACTECGKFICEGCQININGKSVCKTCIESGAYNPRKNDGASYNNADNRYNYGSNNGQMNYNTSYSVNKSGEKSWLVTLLLCLFVGTLGVHRFYVGKIGTGILQLITFGGFGIWTLVDFILIACKRFTDANGNLIID